MLAPRTIRIGRSRRLEWSKKERQALKGEYGGLLSLPLTRFSALG
jgi:hypothetical protein